MQLRSVSTDFTFSFGKMRRDKRTFCALCNTLNYPGRSELYIELYRIMIRITLDKKAGDTPKTWEEQGGNMYGRISRLFILCSIAVGAVFFTWAGEGEFSADIPGTDAVFLSGRTDVVIPELGAYDSAFPLLRHGFVRSDFLKETFPKAIAAKAGMIFTFSATGHVHYYNGPGYGSGFGPDGEAAGMSSLYALGGISGYKGPQGPLTGVFLDDANPALATPPAMLDFWSTGMGTSFSTLSPMLGQVFFIGDGNAAAGSLQTFRPKTYPAVSSDPGRIRVRGQTGRMKTMTAFSVRASYTLPNCAHSGAITQACFYDDFNDNSVNALLWATGVGGSGPSLSETNRSLEVVIPSSSSNNGQIAFSGGVSSSCKLKGDFDIQVDQPSYLALCKRGQGGTGYGGRRGGTHELRNIAGFSRMAARGLPHAFLRWSAGHRFNHGPVGQAETGAHGHYGHRILLR
jgi:hypothetical protein